jgi:hypothetical protein
MKATDPKRINEVVDKDIKYDLEGDLASAINKLQNLYEEHSAKYEHLEIEISMESDYGYEYVAVKLLGFRHETPEEVASRMEADAKYKQRQKDKDLKELERLQKKYEKTIHKC